MKKFFASATALILFIIVSSAPLQASAATIYPTADFPTFVYAPKIGLLSPIQGVGTTASGEMAVPSGYSNNVGWYANGVVPGQTGTAVLDAHVFAAFKNLAKLPVGSDIYIYMESGHVLHYVTTRSQTYLTNSLSPLTLFAPAVNPQLNLITCAGNLTPDHLTYDHRLIVSAQLI